MTIIHYSQNNYLYNYIQSQSLLMTFTSDTDTYVHTGIQSGVTSVSCSMEYRKFITLIVCNATLYARACRVIYLRLFYLKHIQLRADVMKLGSMALLKTNCVLLCTRLTRVLTCIISAILTRYHMYIISYTPKSQSASPLTHPCSQDETLL